MAPAQTFSAAGGDRNGWATTALAEGDGRVPSYVLNEGGTAELPEVDSCVWVGAPGSLPPSITFPKSM